MGLMLFKLETQLAENRGNAFPGLGLCKQIYW